ncbi:MAG: rhodanese-like domain-containing protein [Deltaproteobacteria bacterium]|nr:MAG: rhodanese-like domain-containing protein [Deltaproteobacteria bacterium]
MSSTNTNANVLKSAIFDNGGDPEVTATWLAANRDAVRLVDVREPHELKGPLGAIDDVENVPLLELLGSARKLDKDQPLVLVCRSGRRSAQAAEALRRAGVKTVASVEGGMLAWNLDVKGLQDIHTAERMANTENLREAVFRTNGLPEVDCHWVAKNVGRFRLIDVREPAELAMTGRVAQAENIPLNSFMMSANKLDRDAPIVVMCASGGRSGRVVHALASAGFKSVASLEGGMYGWRSARLPYA